MLHNCRVRCCFSGEHVFMLLLTHRLVFTCFCDACCNTILKKLRMPASGGIWKQLHELIACSKRTTACSYSCIDMGYPQFPNKDVIVYNNFCLYDDSQNKHPE